MKRLPFPLLPFPLLALALLLLWLLLAGLSPRTLASGLVVAIVAPQSLRALGIEAPRVRLGRPAARLLGLVVADIVRSNLAVARLVVGNPPQRHAGFIRMPTDLRRPPALAVLAVIITSTPGTIWVDHDPDRHIITIHVLDLIDEEAWIALLKTRYEKLLLEIFP